MTDLRVTILGCGTSGGVPRVGADWGVCDPEEPRNRRRRCSILVESADTVTLIDTSPDLRQQLLDADVRRVDAVVWTHDHADQCHGIDDLRPLVLKARKPVPAWGDADTLTSLRERFLYCFEGKNHSLYPPLFDARDHCGRSFRVGDMDILPIAQDHGTCTSYGFRIGAMAYSNDVVNLDEAAFSALAGVKVWIVDAIRYKPHPTHAHLEKTLGWIDRLRPERAYLINLHVDMDYRSLCQSLPENIRPTYDGMVITC